jgi:queuine/archaeosine tRNA-ribosyltransferase
VTVHNLSWTLQLMRRLRASILDGTFDSVRAEVAAVWT